MDVSARILVKRLPLLAPIRSASIAETVEDARLAADCMTRQHRSRPGLRESMILIERQVVVQMKGNDDV